MWELNSNGTFTEMTDAKKYLADCVKRWNEGKGDV